MRTKGIQSIGSVYGEMLNSVKTVKLSESTGIKDGGNDLDDDNPAPLEDGGPKKEGGYNEPLEDSVASHYGFNKDEDEEDSYTKSYNDVDECHECGQPDEQCKCDCDEDEEDEDCDDDEETLTESSNESRKIAKRTLNRVMSKQLSFDKLYNQIISENFGEDEGADSELDSLGLDDATPDSDLEDDFGGEDEGGEVTVTLDRTTAETLIDLLQAAIGGGEDDFGDDEFGDDGLDFDTEDDDMDFDEDEETLGDNKSKLQGKDNKVGGKLKPGSNSASSAVTDKVGNDGDCGHAISGAKAVNDGKNNKVGNLTQGSDFFK